MVVRVMRLHSGLRLVLADAACRLLVTAHLFAFNSADGLQAMPALIASGLRRTCLSSCMQELVPRGPDAVVLLDEWVKRAIAVRGGADWGALAHFLVSTSAHASASHDVPTQN